METLPLKGAAKVVQNKHTVKKAKESAKEISKQKHDHNLNMSYLEPTKTCIIMINLKF